MQRGSKEDVASRRKTRLERYKDITRLVLLRRVLSCFSKYSIHAGKVGLSGLLSNRFYRFSLPCSEIKKQEHPNGSPLSHYVLEENPC